MPFWAFSQNNDSCSYNIEDDIKPFISFEASSLSSFHSNPSYFNYFILLHYQNKEDVGKISESLGHNNLFGNLNLTNFNTGMIINKKANLGLSVSFRHSNYQILKTTDDAFDLFMKGNAAFAGKMADFSNTAFVSNSWQSFGLGIYKISPLQNNSCLLYGISLNFINAGSLNKLSISRGSLLTSEDGDSVSLLSTFDLNESKNGKFLGMRSAGSGVGIDAFFKLKFNKQHFIEFSIFDIGLVNFKMRKLYIDTLLEFYGVDLLNGQKFDNSIIPVQLFDTLFNNNEAFQNSLQMLIFSFKLNYRYNFSNKLAISASIFSLTDNFLNPAVSAAVLYSPLRFLELSMGAINDNFNHNGAVFSINFKLKNTQLKISSYHAQQILPNSLAGQHVNFTFIQRF